MDIEEFVWNKIVNNKCNKLIKLVNIYIINVSKVSEFIEILINIYCNNILSKNIWFITKFITYLDSISNTKKNLVENKKIILNIIALFNLELNNIIKFRSSLDDHTKYKITKISNTYKKEYAELDYLKDILLGNIYTLFNAIFGILLNRKGIDDLNVLLIYIISLKNSQLFFRDLKDHNIYDLLFSIFEKLRISEELCDYIILNKTLFNLNVKNKNYIKRINLLLVCFEGYIMDNITNQEIVINPISRSNYLYLYTLHNYDYSKMLEIDREKMKLKTDRLLNKNITIDDNELLNIETRNTIDIIKIK
jgi:hypothetical protein